MQKLSVNEFAKYIQNRRDLYEAVQRNDYYLPKYKCGMITEAYLIGVLKGTLFCPKVTEVKMKQCVRPPSKEALLMKFLKIARDKGWHASAGVDAEHLPDKRWLLDVIATFAPDDEIFKKDYMPPARKNKLSEIKAIELPVEFLADLPESTRRSKRKGLRLAKDGLAAQRLKRLRSLQREIGNRIITEETKKEEVKEKGKTKKSTSSLFEKFEASQKSPSKRKRDQQADESQRMISASPHQPQQTPPPIFNPAVSMSQSFLNISHGDLNTSRESSKKKP